MTQLGAKVFRLFNVPVAAGSASRSFVQPQPVSSSSAITQAEQFPRRPAQFDFVCQFSASCRSVSCQSESPQMFDVVLGPDLIHLETTIALFTPFWEYRPPLPTWRLNIIDADGVIQGHRIMQFGNPELGVPENLFPPETVREIAGQIGPHLLPFFGPSSSVSPPSF